MIKQPNTVDLIADYLAKGGKITKVKRSVSETDWPILLANAKWGHPQYNWGPVSVYHRKIMVEAIAKAILEDRGRTKWSWGDLKEFGEYPLWRYEDTQTSAKLQAWFDTHSYLRQLLQAINILLSTRGLRLIAPGLHNTWDVVERKRK